MKLFCYCIPAFFVLTGCVTMDSDTEVLMPQLQQNTYLSHARPPQEFGFTMFQTPNGVEFNGAARLHPRHYASTPFMKDNIPVIEMQGTSARSKLNVLLDFTSPVSWVEFTASQKLNAKFLGYDGNHFPYRGGYNTGNAVAYGAVVTQMRIDQLFMETVPVYIRMAMNSLGPLARGIEVPKVDAVLGYNNLARFEYLQLDLPNGRFSVSSTAPYEPFEDLLMGTAKIVHLNNYGLAVRGAMFGEETPMLLDFAGDYHFARGDKKVATTRQVSLGDIVYRHVPTMLLPIHDTPPRIGRKMLEKYTITICPRKGVVYFERPEK